MKNQDFDKTMYESLDILRGAISVEDYTQIILSSLTLMYVEAKEEFDLPKEYLWSHVTEHGHSIGDRLQEAAKKTEEAIPFLEKALTSANFSSIDDSVLFQFAIVLNKYKFPTVDEFGTIVEDLLYRFMERQGRNGGENISPNPINLLLPRLLDVKQGTV